MTTNPQRSAPQAPNYPPEYTSAPMTPQGPASPFAPAMAPHYSHPIRSGIEVKMGFSPVAFLLYFRRPVVEINGYPNPLGWGTHFVDLPPGRYLVSIYYSSLFSSRYELKSYEVFLQPGMVRRVNYYAWGED
jgi:hypothetical protein